MGAFSHLSRRRFMKGTALAAGTAAFAPGFLRSRYARAEKRFDIDVPAVWDSNWQNAALWLSPLIKEEAGVGISTHELYDSGETTAKLFPQFLSKNRKYAILLNFIIAAVLTPTPDVVNQLLMAGPLCLLYELGILSARIFGRRARRAPAAAATTSVLVPPGDGGGS